MKKNLLAILSAVAILFAGCKKELPLKPSPGLASDSYWPVTAGNSWTYRDATGGGTSSFTLTMTGDTHTINNKTYYTSTSLKNGDYVTTYIYEQNHIYALRDTLDNLSTSIELQLCADNQPAGYTWTMQCTDDGLISGFPVQTINQIISANDEMTVNGKNYSNVIHTQVKLQYDLGKGFETVAVYDFYLAKGVGMIEADTSSGSNLIESETLTSYSVK